MTQQDVAKVCEVAKARDFHMAISPEVRREVGQEARGHATRKLEGHKRKFGFREYVEDDWVEPIELIETSGTPLEDNYGDLLILAQLCDIVKTGYGAGSILSSDRLFGSIASCIRVNNRPILVVSRVWEVQSPPYS